MFFYRPWIRTDTDDEIFNRPVDFSIYGNYFRESKWGYGLLLGLTFLFGITLNGSFLMSFWGNPSQIDRKYVLNVTLLIFCVRDLLVTLIIVPSVLSWMIFNEGHWLDGAVWCKMAGFFDFFLSAEYPFLIIAFCVILMTRRISKFGDENDDDPDDDLFRYPVDDDFIEGNTPGVTVISPPSFTSSQQRVPSIASAEGYKRNKLTPGGGFYRSKRSGPGSVTGSVEGRLAARSGRLPTTSSLLSSSTSSSSSGIIRTYQPKASSNFRASSPLYEVDESNTIDLWDSASLDYPGRERTTTPSRFEVMSGTPNPYLPPTFHQWHYYILGITWILALAIGISAGVMIRHFVGEQRKPICVIDANPFSNRDSSIIVDPGYNFLLANVILTFLVPIILFVILYCFAVYRRTRNRKFRRYLWLLFSVFVVFCVSRTPVDKIQLQGLIEASMGYKQLNKLPYEIEYEILLLWDTMLPIIIHPILYFAFCSEYRRGASVAWKKICGCYKPSKYVRRSEVELEPKESKTQVSEFL